MGTDTGVAVACDRDWTTDWLDKGHSGAWVPEPILDIAWDPDNRFILYGGTRSGSLWMADTRTAAAQPINLSHGGPISHVRPLRRRCGGGGQEVLLAGPLSKMAVYDTRFARPLSSHNGSPATTYHPLVQFPDFSNLERLHFGLDVEPGLGIVAAAHDDGTVAVYSLRTGRKLRGGEVGNIGSGDPVRSVQFARSAADAQASLWVGASSAAHRFSVWERDPG
jgi:hypothetical protein